VAGEFVDQAEKLLCRVAWQLIHLIQDLVIDVPSRVTIEWNWWFNNAQAVTHGLSPASTSAGAVVCR
jgi:hypothetical protein